MKKSAYFAPSRSMRIAQESGGTRPNQHGHGRTVSNPLHRRLVMCKGELRTGSAREHPLTKTEGWVARMSIRSGKGTGPSRGRRVGLGSALVGLVALALLAVTIASGAPTPTGPGPIIVPAQS